MDRNYPPDRSLNTRSPVEWSGRKHRSATRSPTPESVPMILGEGQPQPDGRRPLRVYAARPVELTTGSGGQPRSGGETLILGGLRRLSTVGLATGALLAFSAATASAAPDSGRLQAERLRGLPQHPAAGPGSERELDPDRRLRGQRHLPAAHERPAAQHVREPDVRDAGPPGLADRQLLQGRELRGEAGQRRAHLQPARRRDDRARQVRRPPHLRRDPRGSDVRRRLRRPPRTACS